MVPKQRPIGIVEIMASASPPLLNLIAERLQPQSGQVIIGETVRVAYFSQQIDGLDRASAWLISSRVAESKDDRWNTTSVPDLLEQFLFPRSIRNLDWKTLQWVRRSASFFLKLLIEKPNVLLLDEPTNDLDIYPWQFWKTSFKLWWASHYRQPRPAISGQGHKQDPGFRKWYIRSSLAIIRITWMKKPLSSSSNGQSQGWKKPNIKPKEEEAYEGYMENKSGQALKQISKPLKIGSQRDWSGMNENGSDDKLSALQRNWIRKMNLARSTIVMNTSELDE